MKLVQVQNKTLRVTESPVKFNDIKSLRHVLFPNLEEIRMVSVISDLSGANERSLRISYVSLWEAYEVLNVFKPLVTCYIHKVYQSLRFWTYRGVFSLFPTCIQNSLAYSI